MLNADNLHRYIDLSEMSCYFDEVKNAEPIDFYDLQDMSKEELKASLRVAINAPILDLVSVANLISAKTVEMNEDGYYERDRIMENILSDVYYFELISNVSIGDAEIDEVYDYIHLWFYGSLLFDRYDYQWKIQEIVDHKWEEYEELNRRKMSSDAFFKQASDSVKEVEKALVAKIEEADIEKIADVVGQGINLLAEKLPDFSDAAQVQNLIKVLGKLPKINPGRRKTKK